MGAERLEGLAGECGIPLDSVFNEAPPQMAGRAIRYPSWMIRDIMGIQEGVELRGRDWIQGTARLNSSNSNAAREYEKKKEINEQKVALQAQIAEKVSKTHAQDPGATGEWFPLGLVSSEPHVIKQIQKCARELLRLRGEGKLRMDSRNSWLESRQIIEDQCAIDTLGANHLAKLWVGWMVLPEERRTDLRMTGYQEIVRRDPRSANFYSHFIAPLNESFGAPEEREMALRTLHERYLSQLEKESLHSWWVRIVSVACKAYGNEFLWSPEVWRQLSDIFTSRALDRTTLNRFAEPDILIYGSMAERMAHVTRLDERLGEGGIFRVPHHPLANGVGHRPREQKPRSQETRDTDRQQASQPGSSKWSNSKKGSNQQRSSRNPGEKQEGKASTVPMDTTILWLKRDGKCGVCNQADPHEQPCTRPKVCWNCGGQDHVRHNCPKSGQKKAKEGGVKYCPPPPTNQPAKPPASAVGAYEGGRSEAGRELGATDTFSNPGSGAFAVTEETPSQVVSRQEQVFLPWNLVAPQGTKFNSLIHYAALFDTGQLSGKEIVVSKQFFDTMLSNGHEPPPTKRKNVGGAGGANLAPYGELEMFVGISGLPNCPLKKVTVLVCKNLDIEVLVGKPTLSGWGIGFHQDPQGNVTWTSGEDSVAGLNREQAERCNRVWKERETIHRPDGGQSRVRVSMGGKWCGVGPEGGYDWGTEPPTWSKTNQKPPPLLVHPRGHPTQESMVGIKREKEEFHPVFFRCAQDVEIPAGRVQKIQAYYPNPQKGLTKGEFCYRAHPTNPQGGLLNLDAEVEHGVLHGLVELQDGQQGLGGTLPLMYVNNTALPITVSCWDIVAIGVPTRTTADPVNQLQEGPGKQKAKAVFSVGPNEKKPSVRAAGTKFTAEEEAFLQSLELDSAPWLRDEPGKAILPEVRELLVSYRDVFTDDLHKVGKAVAVGDFRIDLAPGTQPTRAHNRPLKPDQVQNLRDQLDSWLSDGVVAPSRSAWASPLVPVMKKDGTTRWAVDYRQLNKSTLPDSFPTPRLGDVLEGLAGSKVFSTLDAAQAYHNLPVEASSRSLTAFICCFGLFEFLRMPFGLKNAGAHYCRLVQHMIDTLGVSGVAAYLDDLLLHTEGVEEHLQLVRKVLEAHREVGIKLKPSKTRFFQSKAEYLGFEVSQEGLRMTDKNMELIRDWRAPQSGTELASVIGFFSFYREFSPSFARLSAPLNELKKVKGAWPPGTWTDELQAGFDALKEEFTRAGGPCRAFPMMPGTDGAGEFILYTDWSQEAMAGILHQFQHGVERFIGARGRKCKAYERNYHSSKGELAALHYALGKFEPWLKLGRFTVRTDNTTVTNWQTMEVRNGCVRRWVDFFTEFNFVLQHIPGVKNVPPDSQSRRTDLPEATASEAEAGVEYEVRYPLAEGLPRPRQAPPPEDVPEDECEELNRCVKCVNLLTQQGVTEWGIPAPLGRGGSNTMPIVPQDTPHPFHATGEIQKIFEIEEGEEPGNDAPVRFTLLGMPQAIYEGQGEDPATRAFRDWIAGGRKGKCPSMDSVPEADEEEMAWLRAQELTVFDVRPGKSEHCLKGVLVTPARPEFADTDPRRYKVICPPALRMGVIEVAHTKGHVGTQKTIENVDRTYVWKDLRTQVAQFIKQLCPICVERQKVNLKQGAHVPRVTHHQGEMLYVDLIGPFSAAITPYPYFLSMMDGFSRFVAVAPLRNKKAAEVSQTLLDYWIKIHGLPQKIYSDRGREFTAKIGRSLFEKMGVEVLYGHPDNHQSNPVERFHRTLYELAKGVRREGGNNLLSNFRTACMVYNGNRHGATGVTPNSLHLGKEIPMPTDVLIEKNRLGPQDGPPEELVARLQDEMDKVVTSARRNQQLAIKRNAKYYLDQACRLQEGDLVWAFLEGRGDATPHRKLRIKWTGPYRFKGHLNPVMGLIEEIPSQNPNIVRPLRSFTIHLTKVRLYRRAADPRPRRDPVDLPSFTQEELDLLLDPDDSDLDLISGHFQPMESGDPGMPPPPVTQDAIQTARYPGRSAGNPPPFVQPPETLPGGETTTRDAIPAAHCPGRDAEKPPPVVRPPDALPGEETQEWRPPSPLHTQVGGEGGGDIEDELGLDIRPEDSASQSGRRELSPDPVGEPELTSPQWGKLTDEIPEPRRPREIPVFREEDRGDRRRRADHGRGVSLQRRDDAREDLTGHRRSARTRKLSERRAGLEETAPQESETSQREAHPGHPEPEGSLQEQASREDSPSHPPGLSNASSHSETIRKGQIHNPEQPRRSRGRSRASLSNTFDVPNHDGEAARPLRGKSKLRALPCEERPRAQRREGQCPVKAPRQEGEDLNLAFQRPVSEPGSRNLSENQSTESNPSREDGRDSGVTTGASPPTGAVAALTDLRNFKPPLPRIKGPPAGAGAPPQPPTSLKRRERSGGYHDLDTHHKVASNSVSEPSRREKLHSREPASDFTPPHTHKARSYAETGSVQETGSAQETAQTKNSKPIGIGEALSQVKGLLSVSVTEGANGASRIKVQNERGQSTTLTVPRSDGDLGKKKSQDNVAPPEAATRHPRGGRGPQSPQIFQTEKKGRYLGDAHLPNVFFRSARDQVVKGKAGQALPIEVEIVDNKQRLVSPRNFWTRQGDQKVVLLCWNMGVEKKFKALGHPLRFQIERREFGGKPAVFLYPNSTHDVKVARGTRLGSLAAVNPSLFASLDDLVVEDEGKPEGSAGEHPNRQPHSTSWPSSASASLGDWG